jgi:hypothetical protein
MSQQNSNSHYLYSLLLYFEEEIMGEAWFADHDWHRFVTDMAERFPGYIDEFERLEIMAAEEDLAPLEFLTEHEVVAIES